MPAQTPPLADAAQAQLTQLGEQMRLHRKALGVSAITAAQAAGMSRVTLHRIERGEASVTMGAYLNALAALGLHIGLLPSASAAGTAAGSAPAVARRDWIPVRIALADFPQLKALAWQVQGADTLTPLEAWGLYERNWRHVDEEALLPHERDLIAALRRGLGDGEGETHV